MKLSKFQADLKAFEKNIIIKGFEIGHFSRTMVVGRNCHLDSKEFGRIMGKYIDTDRVLTIDYYGLLKKSRGFLKHIQQTNAKKIESEIISFASIKMEDIVFLSPLDVSIMIGFPRLKNDILIYRGLRKKSCK
ncbi:MAG: hypothetical protein ACTSX0_01450 [Promethearchaeota archaeon]